MKDFFAHVWKVLLITAIGVAGSAIVGLMKHGSDVFNPSGADFAYIAFGASGAFIFAIYHQRGLSNAITAAVSVSAIQFVIASVWIPTLNAAIWSFGVNLPVVWLAFLFEHKLAQFHWTRFIVVGLVYGAMFVLLTLLIGILHNLGGLPPELFRENFLDGFLMGLGMGLGVQAAEAFLQSLPSQRGSVA